MKPGEQGIHGIVVVIGNHEQQYTIAEREEYIVRFARYELGFETVVGVGDYVQLPRHEEETCPEHHLGSLWMGNIPILPGIDEFAKDK
jgi:hypothetical protein